MEKIEDIRLKLINRKNGIKVSIGRTSKYKLENENEKENKDKR